MWCRSQPKTERLSFVFEQPAPVTRVVLLLPSPHSIMADEQDVAAAKMQAMVRGKSTSSEDPRVIKCVHTGDLASLEKLFASGVQATPSALHASIDAPVKAIAAALISKESAWGVGEVELACWKKVQAALHPTPTEDDPEPEQADVTDIEGWQAEAVKELFGTGTGEEKVAPADPTYAFTMRCVVAVGCYAGGRAEPEDKYREPAFDTETTARAGYGVCLLPKGQVYAGYMAGGKREGEGALHTREGTTYVGGWRGGLKHGHGRQVFPDGSVYEGAWRYGMRHGKGVYTYTNGDVYVGSWFTGKKHGAGKYTAKAAGARYTGVWVEGELSKASVATPDGTTFFSSFSSGKPVGEGAFLTGSGALAGGRHPAAPPPPEEGEEPEEGQPLQWTPTALIGSDRTSSGALAKQYGGSGGPAPPKRKALIVAPAYPEGGAFPPLDTAPAAAQLQSFLTSKLGFAGDDVTLLSAAEAADPVEPVAALPAVMGEDGETVETEAVEAVEAKPAVVPATKEQVLAAADAMLAGLGRGDVAMLGFVCHGKKLLDLDAGAEEPAEGLCLIDDALTEEEVAELLSKFAAKSVHLLFYCDSCFDPACFKAPPPNFAAITATLAADAPAPEAPPSGEDGEEAAPPPPRHGFFFADNLTTWLSAAIDKAESPESLSYSELFTGLQEAQEAADARSGIKQVPLLYSTDGADAVLAPLA